MDCRSYNKKTRLRKQITYTISKRNESDRLGLWWNRTLKTDNENVVELNFRWFLLSPCPPEISPFVQVYAGQEQLSTPIGDTRRLARAVGDNTHTVRADRIVPSCPVCEGSFQRGSWCVTWVTILCKWLLAIWCDWEEVDWWDDSGRRPGRYICVAGGTCGR